MIIKHINNSFFQVKTRKTNFVCDPWIGSMKDTGTWSFPNFNNDKKILNKLKPNLIYISHLHSDHLDEKILNLYSKKNTKILIKDFKNKRLKNKLIKLGFKNVIEIKEWSKFVCDDLELTIVPSDVTNSSKIDTKIKYDLDTSIIIYDIKKKTCFYNNVDNPLSEKQINKVFNYCKKNYKKIDIAAVSPRSASEFPQCFINIDRNKFKDKVIESCLNRTKRILKILKVKNYIPAGGSFKIYGKFSSLQKYVAHPSENQIKNFFEDKHINLINIDNNGLVKIENQKIIKIKKNNFKLFDKRILKKKYDYEKQKVNLEKVVKIFKEAVLNYRKILKKNKINIKWNLKFNIYKDLELDDNDKIKKNRKIKTLKINHYKNNKYPILESHLDLKLFYLLLVERYNWNMAIGGSLILFDRIPNKFIPDITFSLNFLKSKI